MMQVRTCRALDLGEKYPFCQKQNKTKQQITKQTNKTKTKQKQTKQDKQNRKHVFSNFRRFYFRIDNFLIKIFGDSTS